MNYRHHFHAGNFADVVKHAVLVQLVRAMQRKGKGFVYLDTHAGRARYDLAAADQGDSLMRSPEWPAGIGRLWNLAEAPEFAREYLWLVRDFDRRHGNLVDLPRFYPGSPLLVAATLRPQDRMVLCEAQTAEWAALKQAMTGLQRCAVHETDGYAALRAMLPPPERRALVLIDPPYEAQTEFIDLVAGLGEGLRRLPAGTFVVWYPLTERARIEAFFNSLAVLPLPPTAVAELTVAGEDSPLKMRGCGLVIVNPPWQFEKEASAGLTALAGLLAQAPGASARYDWLVPEG